MPDASNTTERRHYEGGFIGTTQQLLNALRCEETASPSLNKVLKIAAAEEIERLQLRVIASDATRAPDDPGLSIKSLAPNATPSRYPGKYHIVKGNLP